MFDAAVLSFGRPRTLRLGLMALALVTGAGCHERPRAPAVGAASAAVGAPASASGLRVYRDPVTGAFTAPPAPTPSVGPPGAAQTTAPAAFTEVSAPGGGTMVRLNGAFTSDVRAKLGPHGAEVSCATAAAR